MRAMMLFRHPRRARSGAGLAIAAAATALLSGCGDSMVYYQSRYVPASSDEAFSPASQLSWQGDHEVYELPAEPPAVDESRPRVDCKQPAEVFKGQGMVGLTDDAPPYHDPNPPIRLANQGDDEMVAALPPVKATPVAKFGEMETVGAREPVGPTPVGGSAKGPFPFEASGKNNEPLTMAATRDSDDWCAPQK